MIIFAVNSVSNGGGQSRYDLFGLICLGNLWASIVGC